MKKKKHFVKSSLQIKTFYEMKKIQLNNGINYKPGLWCNYIVLLKQP